MTLEARVGDLCRRVVVGRPGGHDRLRLQTDVRPVPGRGEVAIAVRAAGVNYADVIVRMGLYASARELHGYPITPGFEVAGTVSSVGEGVEDFSPGDRVFAGLLFGGYATHVVVPRSQVFSIPETLSFEQAAALPAVYLTAWFALSFLAHPRAGDRVLIHSAAGGVGSTAVMMAKRLGCEVTGVVGRPEKVEFARSVGCDHVVDASSEGLWRRVRATSDRGYDVILDANGASTLRRSYRHLRRPGKLVVYGFASMLRRGADRPSYLKLAFDWLRTPRFNPLELTQLSKSILAFNLSYLFDRNDLMRDGMTDVLSWLEADEIAPPRTTSFPLEAVADAHRHIESGRSTGKLVLICA